MHPRPLPIPPLLARPISWVYAAGMHVHKALRRRSQHTLPIPVISVGNLSVGGTGKTPLVLHLARELAAAGRKPCIAMRGYAASQTSGSDEAQLYQREFDRLGLDIPVIVGPDRAAGVRALLATGSSIDTVLLDDGFQHRRLARDLDIVLIDATRSPFRDRLLPAGWLREPVSALSRAGAIVVTHAEAVSPSHLADLEHRIERQWGKPPTAITTHEWTALESSYTEGSLPASWLRGKRLLTLCAIGNPDAFLNHAREQIGADPAASIILRDHDPYHPTTVERVLAAAKGMDAILTTEKDWVKLKHLDANGWPCPVVWPRLSLRVIRGETALMSLVLGATTP